MLSDEHMNGWFTVKQILASECEEDLRLKCLGECCKIVPSDILVDSG